MREVGLIALYRDPAKKKLQRVQIAFLLVILPVSLVWGSRSYTEWSRFRQAEQLFQEADALLHSGKSELAIEKLEQSVAQYPQFYGAWETLATMYHFRQDHKAEADAYSRAVAVLPERGELWRELGTSSHELGDHKRELEQLTRAQELLGSKEIFTIRLLDRAQREAAGTYPEEVARGPAATPSSDHHSHPATHP